MLQTILEATAVRQASAAERIPAMCEGLLDDTDNSKCMEDTGVVAMILGTAATVLTVAGAATYALLTADPKKKS